MGDTTLKESLASLSSDSSLYMDPDETGAVLRLHYANRYLIELVEKRVRRTPLAMILQTCVFQTTYQEPRRLTFQKQLVDQKQNSGS